MAVLFLNFLDQICPKWIKLDQIGFPHQYSYLSNKRVYQLSIQGDIYEKKIKHVGKQST